jgi:hypothetical protein
MEGMPHLVEMHKKYADKGLIILTVSVDPLDKKDLVKQANDFLRRLDAPFRNLLLNESDDFVEKKLGFVFPPCYYAFDRRGKWIRFKGTEYDDGVLHAELMKVVVRMLNDK